MSDLTKKIIITLAIIAVALIIILPCVYMVKETEQVVITQFGKPIGEPKMTPGLKLKVPFIQKANFFEKRYMAVSYTHLTLPTNREV